MKREEAIKLLNDIHSQCCDTANILCTLDADKRCDALQMAITALQNYPVWIPVSERLPGKDIGDYPINMVTLDNGEVCIGVYRHDSKEWWTRMNEGETLYSTDHVVVAWMPLPEPYWESEGKIMAKCKNCKNLYNLSDEDDVIIGKWCPKINDSPHLDIERDCDHYSPMTNADRIRSMTDNELAMAILCVLRNLIKKVRNEDAG